MRWWEIKEKGELGGGEERVMKKRLKMGEEDMDGNGLHSWAQETGGN